MKTSFSSAPLQIGRLYDRQKARLHILHDAEAPPARALKADGVKSSDGEACSVPSLMMVLFEKQVHLQKLSGAVEQDVSISLWWADDE